MLDGEQVSLGWRPYRLQGPTECRWHLRTKPTGSPRAEHSGPDRPGYVASRQRREPLALQIRRPGARAPGEHLVYPGLHGINAPASVAGAGELEPPNLVLSR